MLDLNKLNTYDKAWSILSSEAVRGPGQGLLNPPQYGQEPGVAVHQAPVLPAPQPYHIAKQEKTPL